MLNSKLLPKIKITNMELKIFGGTDQRTLEQIERCGLHADYGVLCADNHLGYSQPIGAALAYENYISPSGVGYDIACGNLAVRTNIKADDIEVGKIMDEIYSRISFGMGRANNEPLDHIVLEDIKNANFEPQRKLLDLAAKQLGTVGSGNHYVDLFRDENGWLWVGVHFGSRGFGHKTATGFLAMAQGRSFDDKASEGEMDSPPVLFDIHSTLGQSYIEAMNLAGAYAYAGRDSVVNKVLEILGTEAVEGVHNHHNFAWEEKHFGKEYWVVRKGCTPAFPGQQGFVGATMLGTSVILQGIDSQESQQSLYSTVHGAGRIMSRTQAAGKSRFRKEYRCGQRDCDGSVPYRELAPNEKKPVCPKCGSKTNKWKGKVQIYPGAVDWAFVKDTMRTNNVELRGGGADEAPEVYKNLSEVLAFHGTTIQIKHYLEPIGVAMAGAEIFDPYKD